MYLAPLTVLRQLSVLAVAASLAVAATAFAQTKDKLREATELLESASSQRDRSQREQTLRQAIGQLEALLKEHADDPQAGAALSPLANACVTLARDRVQMAKAAAAAEDRKPLLGEAKELYDKALSHFSARREQVGDELKKVGRIPDPRNNELQRLRAEYLQTELLKAATLEESADVYVDDQPRRDKALTAAAAAYKEVHEKYRTRLAGLYARMYEARCYQKLGQLKQALSYCEELLQASPGDQPPFRSLRLKTLNLASDCWLHASRKNYRRALVATEEWLQKLQPAEEADAEVQLLQLNLARAHVGMAGLPETENATRQEHREKAIELARKVARTSTLHGEKATRLLLQLSGSGPAGNQSSARDAAPQPQSFTEARNLGRARLNQIRLLQQERAKLQRQAATAPDDEKRALRQKIDDIERALSEQSRLAVDSLRRAVALADKETPASDVNVVKYLLCYVHYTQDDYQQAVQLGETLARGAADDPVARQGAKITLASYVKQFGAAAPEEQRAAAERTLGMARYIVKQWPKDALAAEANRVIEAVQSRFSDLEP